MNLHATKVGPIEIDMAFWSAEGRVLQPMAQINRPRQANASFTPEIGIRIAKRLGLSEGERHIAELLYDGSLEKQASCKLGMAQGTGHAHVRKIYEKLRVRNQAQLSRKIMSAATLLQLDQELASPARVIILPSL